MAIVSYHGTVWMYAQFGYLVTYSFFNYYTSHIHACINCMCEICEMCKSTLACREPIAILYSELFSSH